MSDGMKQWSVLGERSGRGDSDQVIYYRRPNKGMNAGWIVFGDSLSGSKLRDFVKRGFEPLMQYGPINTPERNARREGTASMPPDPNMTNERYSWEAILMHPNGSAEFPVEQLITYRWYRPELCPVPGVSFPQLKGLKIKEYNCPERCGRAPFVDVDGVGGVGILRQHLRIMHKWDQANLIAYGEKVGIDFTKVDVATLAVNEYEIPESQEYKCEECGFTAKNAFGLQAHQRSHPMVEVEAVG